MPWSVEIMKTPKRSILNMATMLLRHFIEKDLLELLSNSSNHLIVVLVEISIISGRLPSQLSAQIGAGPRT